MNVSTLQRCTKGEQTSKPEHEAQANNPQKKTPKKRYRLGGCRPGQVFVPAVSLMQEHTD
jgi:hypothetical protein